MTIASPILCPPGTHFEVIDHQEHCVPDVHAVPVGDTLSLVGVALAILCVAIFRRKV